MSSGGGSTTTAPVQLGGMQVQTSVAGIPIPVIYGLTRAPINLVEYTDFVAIKQGSGGAKGGKGGSGNSYDYKAAVAGALCEGPITNTTTTWVNQTAQASSTAGFLFFNGALGQAPWGYLSSNHPDEAVPYSGISYIAWPLLDLSSSATMPSYNLELQALFYGSAPNGADADPSLVIPDILSNPQYGAGFPATRIGSVISNAEAHTVPASGPYTVTVTNHAAYDYNLDVEDAAGTPWTCVAGAPGNLQYAFNETTGVYTFNASQAGTPITINYVSRGGLTEYQNFTLASGLVISPVYSDQTDVASILNDIAKFTYSEFVWSGGVLTLVPRASSAVSGSGYTFTPPPEAEFDLADDDYVVGGGGGSSQDDPVLLTRSRISDVINDIKLEYLDRANQYAPAIAEASDQALIDQYTRRADSSAQAHLFCDGTAANVSAQLLLQKQYILNSYATGLDGRYCCLDPMDIVTLTDPGMSLNKQAVRVLESTENQDGSFTIVAEEYPGGLGATAEYALNQNSGYVANYRVSPGSINTPVIFEPSTVYLSANSEATPQIVIGVSGSNPNWGGSQVLISLDNVDYIPLGNIDRAATQGVLTATLATGSDPDTANTLSVDLTQSFGALSSVTQLNADNFVSACLAVVQNTDGSDAELISFEQATLTAPYTYDLGKHGSTAGRLRRGVYSTSIASHATGSQFCLLDDNVFTFDLPIAPVSYVGKTLYLKFLSVNIYGQGRETEADVSPYVYDPTGIAAFVAPPSNVTISSGVKQQPDGTVQPFMQISWTASPDPVFDRYEVQWRTHTGPGPWLDQFVAADTTSLTIAPIAPLTTFDAQVRAVRSTSNTGPFFSAWAQDLNVLTVFKTAAPADPTGLGAVGSYRSVRLTWTAAAESDIAGYEVWQGAASTLTSAFQIAEIATTNFPVAGLANATQYYFWIRSVDTSGNKGNFVGPATATTLLIDNTSLSTGLQFTQLVATISAANPATSNFAIALDTMKSYRYNPATSAWTTALDGSDIEVDTLEANRIVSASITALQVAAAAFGGDKFTGNFFEGYNFTAHSGGGSSAVSLYGGTYSSGGLNYGPYFAVQDTSGAIRAIIGQWGSQWGIFVWNSAGTEILSASDLGVNVVGTNNISANAVTSTATASGSGFSQYIDNSVYTSGTTIYTALASTAIVVVSGASVSIDIAITGLTAYGTNGGAAYVRLYRTDFTGGGGTVDTGLIYLATGASAENVTTFTTDTPSFSGATNTYGYQLYMVQSVPGGWAGPPSPPATSVAEADQSVMPLYQFKR